MKEGCIYHSCNFGKKNNFGEVVYSRKIETETSKNNAIDKEMAQSDKTSQVSNNLFLENE